MRRLSPQALPALESLPNTMIADPADPRANQPLPMGGAAFDVSAVKLTLTGQLEREPLVAQNKPYRCKHCGALACENEDHEMNLSAEDLADLDDEHRLNTSQAELDAQVVAIEEASDVVVALEELAQALPINDPQAGRIAAIYAKHHAERMGLSLEDSEDFDFDEPTKLRKAAAALAEKARKVWQAIIEALKRAWKWLKEHVRQLLDMSGRAKKRAEELLDKVKKAKLGNKTTTEISSGRLANALGVEYKFPDNLTEVASRTALVVNARLEKAYGQHLYDELVLKQLTDGRSDFNYDPVKEKQQNMLTKLHPGDVKEGLVRRTDPLLGDALLVQHLGPAACDGYEALRWMLQTPRLVIQTQDTKQELSAKIPVATHAQMLTCAEAALGLATDVNNFRLVVQHLDDLAERMIKAAQGNLGNDKHPNGQPTGALAEQQKWQRKYLSSAPRWLVAEPTQLANYALTKANALMSYVEKSLAQYEVASEAAPA